MLSFSLVAEALTGLIYHHPSGENSNFKSPGLHQVEHGITKREATPPFPPKFYMSQIIEWYLQTG